MNEKKTIKRKAENESKANISPTTSHNTHLSQHCSRARKNKKSGNELGRRKGNRWNFFEDQFYC